METYNGIFIRATIKTNRIVSAFQNEIDNDKIDEFTEVFNQEMLSHDFPDIIGFPSIISDTDFGKEFLTGEKITEEHLGEYFWNVTDGHHRSIAAINANLPFIGTTLDYSCITNENEL